MKELIEKIVDGVRETCYQMGLDESQTEILVDGIKEDYEEAKAYNESVKGDLISRSALLEEIKSLRVTVMGLRAGKGVLSEYANQYRDTLLRVIEEQPTAYNDGWIPVSSGKLPEDCTIYEVTAQFGNGMCYTEFAYYDESKGEWWKHDDDGLVNVLAWKEHFAPYQPKGE